MRCGESLFKYLPNLDPVELVQSPGRRRSFRFARDNKTSDSVIDDLRHRAIPPSHHRGSAGHCLDHGHPKRLAPRDRKQQTYRIAEEFRLLGIAYLADELDMRLREERLDLLFEVLLIDAIDFSRDLQFHAGQRRDPELHHVEAAVAARSVVARACRANRRSIASKEGEQHRREACDLGDAEAVQLLQKLEPR
jgi:hypothetical protein